MERNYEVMQREGSTGLVKAWVRGVPVEEAAKQQLLNTASLPFIHKWVAAMPDTHLGFGATAGSVVPTRGAIVPAAVGVDIGCGMMAAMTSLVAEDLPDNLRKVRSAIERAVPHGRTRDGRRGDRGAWGTLPRAHAKAWAGLATEFEVICDKYPKVAKSNHSCHLGTLGTGNHFIEVCLDEAKRVWIMLHSGSRGVGNRIGSYFISLAKQDMGRFFIDLPDKDLAYFPEETEHFDDYVQAVGWAQGYARTNRELMMASVVDAMGGVLGGFDVDELAVNCHHNYVEKEHHYGADVWVTRKGAVRARVGDFGIIPGSMGARSYIVRGLGNPESFDSCSHGAGRTMSRTAARRRFTIAQHEAATRGVECRKDASVLDETPMAYKDIDAVMEAQKDLVEVVHTLKQIVCVKG
ncbi:MAG: RtcB family protein [Deltaproteobacteria bacterium]|nr:RtcB family protein [Deltaproteobacteria bacterium]